MPLRRKVFTDREVKQAIGNCKFEEGSSCTEAQKDRNTRILPFQAVNGKFPLPGITRKEESNIFAYISEWQRITLSGMAFCLRLRIERDQEFRFIYLQIDYFILSKNHKVSRTCTSSPVGDSQRNHSVFMENSVRYSQGHSISGNLQSLQKMHRTVSSSYVFNGPDPSAHKHLSTAKSDTETRLPHLPKFISHGIKDKTKENYPQKKVNDNNPTHKVKPSQNECPQKSNHDSSKDLYMWGEGIEAGVLGGGCSKGSTLDVTAFDALLPKLLECPGVPDIRNVSCGRKHAGIITKKGEVFCWGEDSNGEMGHKINMDVPNPKVIESLNGVRIVAIDCAANHTCALTNSGKLYAWGDNACGFELLDHGKSRSQWIPHRFSGPLEGICFTRVACGEWHTAVVSSSGSLFTFGMGAFGVLGHGNVEDVSQPKQVESLKGLRVKSIACGPCHTATIVEIMVSRFQCNSAGGKLFTWGDNGKGKLGHGDEERRFLPTCVASLVDFDFVQVSCGYTLTVGLTTTGKVFTMGSSENGQLGNPLAEDKSVTAVEGNLKDKHVRKISSGLSHVVVLTTEGEVYSWGKGANGRLGLGDTEDRNSPALVDSLKPNQVETIASGYSFTAAICLRKSNLSKDQSNCKGCKMLFGLTRRRHYCYSCNFAFCNSCISKRSSNVSMGQSRSKQFRICDHCFSQLAMSMSGRSITRNQTPRLTSSALLGVPDQKMVCEERISPQQNAIKFLQRKTSVKHGKEQKSNNGILHLPITIQRWGEVPCPSQFASCLEHPNITSGLSKGDFGSHYKFIPQELPRPTKMLRRVATKLESVSSESRSMLSEELQRLHAQVQSLTEECNVKSEKLHTYKRRIDDAWSVAKAEAENFKDAKDIISILTAQLNALSCKVYTKGEINNLKSVLSEKSDLCTLQIPPVQTENLKSGHAVLPVSCKESCCGNRIPTERKASVSMQVEHISYTDGNDSNTRPNIPKFQKDECVQQDTPGVYITLLQLLNGKKSIKRVRFSRRYFSEMEAKRWWKDNQTRIYLKYDVEQSLSTVTNKTAIAGAQLVPWVSLRQRRAAHVPNWVLSSSSSHSSATSHFLTQPNSPLLRISHFRSQKDHLLVACLPSSPSTSNIGAVATKIYISGLSFRTTEESLGNAFEKFEQLVEVNLVMDRVANRPRGFAFIRYATEDEAKMAIEGMHRKFLDGRVIFVEVSKPKSSLRQDSKQDPRR